MFPPLDMRRELRVCRVFDGLPLFVKLCSDGHQRTSYIRIFFRRQQPHVASKNSCQHTLPRLQNMPRWRCASSISEQMLSRKLAAQTHKLDAFWFLEKKAPLRPARFMTDVKLLAYFANTCFLKMACVLKPQTGQSYQARCLRLLAIHQPKTHKCLVVYIFPTERRLNPQLF